MSWLLDGRPEHPPVVFAEKDGTAMRIAALDHPARAAGLRPGQALAEARAIRPDIEVVPHDPAADQALLNGIADWCGRYTPLVASNAPDGLSLDVTGCIHLHGSEKALLDDLLSRLFHLGIEGRAAIAATPGLAWAAARYGGGPVVAPEGGARVLEPLPVAALRLPADTVAALARVGLKRVGELMRAERAPLARRFGPLPLKRLDQALGREDEPISPRLPAADLSCERHLADPVTGEDDILAVTARLAEGLKVRLDRRGEGGRLFELALFRVDGRVLRIETRTAAPLRAPERIAGLFAERLQALHDDIDAGFGFETLRLSVLRAERLDGLQADLAGGAAGEAALAAFADRLFARFGRDGLLVPVFAESHCPERAAGFAPYAQRPAAPRRTGAEGPRADRPLRLLERPEPVEATAIEIPEGAPRQFRWRRAVHRVRAAEGPERLTAEWWNAAGPAPARDYFRVEDEAGRRFWLFRQGLYGRDGDEPPRWFLHGLFA
ncbi:DUF6504 family protein [Ensifer soli]|uniref:DUF6504 family protein n=1 Tax=Ciceribacter sp. sgz301302 TaxID=3342379 RepID=UPI0035BC5A38